MSHFHVHFQYSHGKLCPLPACVYDLGVVVGLERVVEGDERRNGMESIVVQGDKGSQLCFSAVWFCHLQYIGWLNTVAAMEKSSQKTAIDAFLDTTAAQVGFLFQHFPTFHVVHKPGHTRDTNSREIECLWTLRG
jgi:hypothetical protein